MGDKYMVLSDVGLLCMMECLEDEKRDKIKDRDDVGKNWTESKIECWKKTHDKEIKEIEGEIEAIKVEYDERIRR